MTDRELLELAAKAAGIPLQWKEDGRSFQLIKGFPFTWDPIADDGDSLRLAVKLEIDICTRYLSDRKEAWATCLLSGKEFGVKVDFFNEDQGSAIRESIVRVAAEIGRAMK